MHKKAYFSHQISNFIFPLKFIQIMVHVQGGGPFFRAKTVKPFPPLHIKNERSLIFPLKRILLTESCKFIRHPPCLLKSFGNADPPQFIRPPPRLFGTEEQGGGSQFFSPEFRECSTIMGRGGVKIQVFFPRRKCESGTPHTFPYFFYFSYTDRGQGAKPSKIPLLMIHCVFNCV